MPLQHCDSAWCQTSPFAAVHWASESWSFRLQSVNWCHTCDWFVVAQGGAFWQRLVSVAHIHYSDRYLLSRLNQCHGYVQSFMVTRLQAGFHCAVCHLLWISQPRSHRSLTSRSVRKKDLGWAPGHHNNTFSSPSHIMWHFKWACRMSSPRMICLWSLQQTSNSRVHSIPESAPPGPPSWPSFQGLLDAICRTYDKLGFFLGSPAAMSGLAVVTDAPVCMVMCQAISD
jgi:hypothetical protein